MKVTKTKLNTALESEIEIAQHNTKKCTEHVKSNQILKAVCYKSVFIYVLGSSMWLKF